MHKVVLVFCLNIFVYGYYPTIIAATGNNGFILPSNSYLTNVSPVINNSGDIAFSAMIPGQGGVVSGIFYKANHEKEVRIYKSFSDGVFAADLSLTDNSVLGIGSHDGGQSVGLYSFDIKSDLFSTLKEPSKNTYALTGLGLNHSGKFVFRQIDDKGEYAYQRRLILNDGIKEQTIFSDGDGNVSYLFSHRFSGHIILFKARYGNVGEISENRPDKLWKYNISQKKFTLVAQDSDAQPSSKIKSLENQYAISDNGKVAFFANTENGIVLFMSSEFGPKTVLTEGIEIKNFDRFSPSINNDGNILIRGEGHDGKKSLFLYKDGVWNSVISEGEKLSIIGINYTVTNSRGITFVGRPMLSNNGEIVFNSLLRHDDSGELVEAIVKLEN